MTIECNILIRTAGREEMIMYIRKMKPAYQYVSFSEFTTEEIQKIYFSIKRRNKESHVSFSKI